ncbi:hypothetical protein ALO_05128 [Acetonema longum DSM 6540]|uniref:Uncharacterized protein n=1 Tax=Acetonema longum DSM 6540 TaxID=1009370 RepID=F7NG39_9FIRM|nr:hypothetical protein ALO_05128 [Acetonema longum DSM 6540]
MGKKSYNKETVLVSGGGMSSDIFSLYGKDIIAAAGFGLQFANRWVK